MVDQFISYRRQIEDLLTKINTAIEDATTGYQPYRFVCLVTVSALANIILDLDYAAGLNVIAEPPKMLYLN